MGGEIAVTRILPAPVASLILAITPAAGTSQNSATGFLNATMDRYVETVKDIENFEYTKRMLEGSP